MNNNERKLFWETLLLEHNAIASKDLQSKTIYPPKIYRYRKTDSKTLSTLQSNTLYFSRSDYYDDPFDTNIHVDMQYLYNILNYMSEKSISSSVFDLYEKMFGSVFDMSLLNTSFDFKKSELEWYINRVRTDIRKSSWSVCFSETGINETLWIKYANQHKGFALEYEIYNNDLILCGKQESCKSCTWGNNSKSIYPVYYSDVKYDATKFSLCFLLERLLYTKNTSESMKAREALILNCPFYWERERIALIKKDCHRYDQEWRIIVPDSESNTNPYMKWIPSAVILGLKTPEYERALIISLAKEAGIPKIKRVKINTNDDLEIEDI